MIRKLMTMHKAFPTRYDIDYVCEEKEKNYSPVLKIAKMHV